MTLQIIIQIILLGIALSMDAFAVSITQGLTYQDLNKKRSIFIAGTYGFCQALFPLIGFWIVEIVCIVVGKSAGAEAGEIMSTIVTWLSFALLMFIGGKMLIEAIRDIKKPAEEKTIKTFSIKEVLIMGVATAIDALATGVSLHNENAEGVALSNTSTIWLHAVIIMCCTFIISLVGVILSSKINKVLKGKFEITGIIGGSILILLGIWITLSHYIGL